MLDQTQTATQEFDPFESASNPVQRSFDLWGKVDLSAWACALVKGTGKVPYDSNNPDHKRFTAIDIFVQPLIELDVKYPKSLEDHQIAEFPEWAKITLPSIKALGIDNVREVNGKWARIARVPNGKKYEKKDKATGNGTGEYADETTFKFIALFDTEDACRADYLANGGKPLDGNGKNAPQPIGEDTEKNTAQVFLRVIVENAVRGTADWASAKEAVAKALPQHTAIAKYFTVDSVETLQLITTITGYLPF
jgi:hypothetical protein